MFRKEQIQYAEDDKASIKRLLKLRVPSLLLGLFLGLLLSFVTSKFEVVLAQQLALTFFIPFIVYLADAVGTQTQTIYIRDLKTGSASFKTYLFKESILGIILGVAFGLLTIPITLVWFQSRELTLAVALGILAAVSFAPLIALIVSEILELEHEDPAVWAGPIATVIRDTVSIVIYGLIASAIIL